MMLYSKFFILLGVVWMYRNTQDKMLASCLWAGTVFLLALLSHGVNISVLVSTIITFLIALGAFTLYEHFEGKLILQIFVAAFTILFTFFVM